ncbi:cupin domain-containing protein [Cesiribacter sp. SM1]|uniref:cupin domain-containing protein n=1 Tax=Cesiribacter sp. SM1 TaxID=2861196 RepID=UPI001CD1BB15|nr:cupin domain-containing protein [Cesiribacter sp. SM1]
MLAYISSPAVPENKSALTPAGLSRTISSSAGGYDMEFIRTPEETSGQYLEVEVVMKPKGGNDMHYHTTFIEEFIVVEGILGIQVEKELLHLIPGEKAVAPLYKLHRFFNPSETEPVRFRVLVKPARFFEATLRIAHGLANDGLCNKKGLPKSIWHLALLFEMGESYAPILPHSLQTGLCSILAGIARWLGKDKELEKYYKATASTLARQ